MRRSAFTIFVRLALIASGCSHESLPRDCLPPNADQIGCFDVAVSRPLRIRVPFPRRLELRPEKSTCDFDQGDFVALSRDLRYQNDDRRDGHWWRSDSRRIRVTRGTHFSGVWFDLAQSATGYSGMLGTFADIDGVEHDETEVELLRRPACSDRDRR